jgi:hypothetical protein
MIQVQINQDKIETDLRECRISKFFISYPVYSI